MRRVDFKLPEPESGKGVVAELTDNFHILYKEWLAIQVPEGLKESLGKLNKQVYFL